MPIPTALRQLGATVSYSDQANPRRVGEIIEADPTDPCCQYTVRWRDDGSTSTSDLRQHGWHLVAEDIHATPDGIQVGAFHGADIISIYTRAEAIDDGFLVDVTEASKEAGFKIPVALTRAAWEDCVEWPETLGGFQSENARLLDVLWMTVNAIRRAKDDSRAHVSLLRVSRSRPLAEPLMAHLVAIIGPGDTHDPVITIKLREEGD